MAESEAHYKWTRDNNIFVTLKLHNRNDSDIIAYLDGKKKQTEIKQLIREALAARKQS